MGNFTHLHVHTEYSLLDGAARIDKLIDRCLELGQDAVAITDHGVMYGVVAFYKKCKAKGIKPIIGCELYVVNDMSVKKGREHREHLVLLAKDEVGYRNIVKLDSLAFVDGYHMGKPRIDFNLLKEHTEGVVCLTGCLAGYIPRALLEGRETDAENYLIELKKLFKDDLYVEIQDHGLSEQKYVTPKLIALAKKHDVKLIATNDVHYIKSSDAEMHDVLLCIQTGAKLSDEKRMRFDTKEFYLKSEEEMRALFPYCEEAIDNTREIVDKCNCEIRFHMPLLPPYVPDNGMTAEEFLRDLTYKGLPTRYDEITPEIKERAEYELGIITKMGYIEYFLIVWDFINYARVNGIPVGYGRGSGVGSIVAYATGITNVDPLRFHLFFERFLNPERVSMPDFDIDFCCERRQEVIEYVNRKYGKDNVTRIVTFGRLAPKNAIRDTARVYDIPLPDVDRITKLIPTQPVGKVSLKKIFIKNKDGKYDIPVPELVKIYEEDELLKRIINMAIEVEGMPRNTGMHAAGVVICSSVISDYVPLQRNGDEITTQFVMTEVEELGLLKMDFLGLITLTDLKKATDYVKENYDIDVDFKKLPDNDQEVYKLIGDGNTEGVFQLESAGMKKFMMNLKPKSMEDIIAGISLFRPGPMDSIPDYLKGKNDPRNVKYASTLLRDILDVTYGVIIYQEQVMQIVQKLAGYSLGQADIIRRAMSKKKAYEMEIHRKLFIFGGEEPSKKVHIDGAKSRGMSEEDAGKLFDKMETFASYAFNKSHAAAYATVSYQTAYFMRYYPCEFFCSVLNNRIAKLDEIKKYTSFAIEKGIKILPPDINKSVAYFKATKDNELRFGLAAVKGVGEAVVQDIIIEREKNGDFKDFGDFLERTCEKINKKLVENLIKAGAFDCFGYFRAQLASVYQNALDIISHDKKGRASGQVSFFDELIEDSKIEIRYPEETKEYPDKIKLDEEKEVLGIYVSGHPLNQYKEILASMPFNTSMLLPLGEDSDEETGEISDVNSQAFLANREKVTLGGILKDVTQVMTKAGKIMKYGKFEDLYSTIDIIFFPRVFDKYKNIIEDGNVLCVTGQMTIKNDKAYQLNVESCKALSKEDNLGEVVDEKPKRLFLKIDSEEENSEVQDILLSYEGNVEVVVKFMGNAYKLPYKVKANDALINELSTVLGEADVVVK